MIKKISSGIALTIHVLKNALLRPFRVIYSKINYMFSAGRVATAIPGAVKKLPKIAKRKPEKREDYFDWGSIYVAKSLVLLVAVLLVAIPLCTYSCFIRCLPAGGGSGTSAGMTPR